MNHSSEASPKLFWRGLLVLAIIKLLIHAFTQGTGYGLHRDEYLYVAISEHLAWGYLEVPPMIAMIGKVGIALLGKSFFTVRLLPALAGAASIVVVGAMAKELGGGRKAQMLAGITFLISPAFLASNNLFQPVTFNQLMWLLCAFTLLRAINYARSKDWYIFGLIAGLGVLTKYSIAFFLVGLAAGILLSEHRQQLRKHAPWLAVGIALLVALPNLYWQYAHNWPVVGHMEELARTQLVYMTTADFVIPQFGFHTGGNIIWLAGLWGLFTWTSLRIYRPFAIAFVVTVLLLFAFSGKAYYAIGAYTMLFAAGAVVWEQWLDREIWWLVPVMMAFNIPLLPYGLPILTAEQMTNYGQYMRDNFGFEIPLRWEDGVIRNLPQDQADMLGWEELPEKVAKLYGSLSPEDQAGCLLYAGNYGQAGVINFFREQYGLPECQSFNSSYALWLQPNMPSIRCQIQVDDSWQDSSESFAQVTFIDSIGHPLARDPGYIFLKTEPLGNLPPVWQGIVEEVQAPYGL